MELEAYRRLDERTPQWKRCISPGWTRGPTRTSRSSVRCTSRRCASCRTACSPCCATWRATPPTPSPVYDHCLQTATRALRDGKDEEYVAVALLHDACEPLGPFNHGEVIGSILRPFVSRDNWWMLTQHGLFQTYFYARHLGLDPNARDKFKCDPAYEQTVEFAPSTTRCRSIPPIGTSRCRRSSRWCAGCSRRNGTPPA